MESTRRLRTGLCGVAALATAFAACRVPAGAARPARPRLAECPSVQVSVVRTIDTKRAKAGDRFEFATAYDIRVNLRKIARGTRGAGFIETLDHSRGGGHSGYLVLNAQYIRLPNGRHVPVAIAPGSDGQSAAFIVAGRTDMPGALGYTPLVAFTSAYNLFHHGKDAAVVAGTRFPIIVGDGLAAGTCRVSWMP